MGRGKGAGGVQPLSEMKPSLVKFVYLTSQLRHSLKLWIRPWSSFDLYKLNLIALVFTFFDLSAFGLV